MSAVRSMRDKRWSLSVPLDGFTLAEHAELAREAERLGYTDAWSLEVDGVDCFAPLAVVGLATHLRVGTAIARVAGPRVYTFASAGPTRRWVARPTTASGAKQSTPSTSSDHASVYPSRSASRASPACSASVKPSS